MDCFKEGHRVSKGIFHLKFKLNLDIANLIRNCIENTCNVLLENEEFLNHLGINFIYFCEFIGINAIHTQVL